MTLKEEEERMQSLGFSPPDSNLDTPADEKKGHDFA